MLGLVSRSTPQKGSAFSSAITRISVRQNDPPPKNAPSANPPNHPAPPPPPPPPPPPFLSGPLTTPGRRRPLAVRTAPIMAAAVSSTSAELVADLSCAAFNDRAMSPLFLRVSSLHPSNQLPLTGAPLRTTANCQSGLSHSLRPVGGPSAALPSSTSAPAGANCTI